MFHLTVMSYLISWPHEWVFIDGFASYKKIPSR